MRHASIIVYGVVCGRMLLLEFSNYESSKCVYLSCKIMGKARKVIGHGQL